MNTSGHNNTPKRCRAAREYRNKETEEVTSRVQCGYEFKHLGPHTFEQALQPVSVQIRPVRLPQMVMECPGCRARVEQLIPMQMAQAIHSGAEPQGMCQKCGHPVSFVKRRIALARR